MGEEIMASQSDSESTRAGGQTGRAAQYQISDPPTFPPSLINEPTPNPPVLQSVGPLEYLVGTWRNVNIGTSGRGGPLEPFSYNLMSLPQAPAAGPSSPFGYILKSMSYYEEITFSKVFGTAPNRGGAGTQTSNALVYEQRVYIADGPAINNLVHFENGIWGFLQPTAQLVGPYGNGNEFGIGKQTFGDVPIAPRYNIFKQLSVPHGNSILACGNVAIDANNNAIPTPGRPTIDPPPQVLPVGIDTQIYFSADTPQNLDSDYALNPHQPLDDALSACRSCRVRNYIRIDVSSAQGGGSVSNIDFEQVVSKVTQYQATYWIEDTGNGKFDQLQYSQTIMLRIPVLLPGQTLPTIIYFPHITANTLTRVSG
jgi:hypothetical protein